MKSVFINRYDSDEVFIRAVIKVQQGNEDDLTIAEAKKIEPWKKVDPEELSAAQELRLALSARVLPNTKPPVLRLVAGSHFS